MSEPYVVINGLIKFSGECENAKPFCGAICCRNTLILLTEEEKESGLYDYVEPTDGCNCTACQIMRQRKMSSLRRNNNGCIYLDGQNCCSLYEKDQLPKMCKDFACKTTWWRLSVTTPMRTENGGLAQQGDRI